MNFASGCCNNYGGPDFSKMDFKTLTCRVVQVNWCEKNLWISIAAIFCLPAFCATVQCMRCSPVPCMSTSHFLEMLVFIFNILKLYIFFQMVDRQPRWTAMLDSNIHSAGYLMMGVGLLLSTACLGVFGPCDTFVRVEPPLSSRGKQGSRYIRRRYRDLARALKTASFFCHLGYSFIDIAPMPLILNPHPEPHLSCHIHATNNPQGAVRIKLS